MSTSNKSETANTANVTAKPVPATKAELPVATEAAAKSVAAKQEDQAEAPAARFVSRRVWPD